MPLPIKDYESLDPIDVGIFDTKAVMAGTNNPSDLLQEFGHVRLLSSARMHQDILYGYQKEIEFVVVDLMRIYLILDPSWPHAKRWLDGLSEEFSWEKKRGLLYGNGELFWGHWPEVGDYWVEIYGCSQALQIAWSRISVRIW